MGNVLFGLERFVVVTASSVLGAVVLLGTTVVALNRGSGCPASASRCSPSRASCSSSGPRAARRGTSGPSRFASWARCGRSRLLGQAPDLGVQRARQRPERPGGRGAGGPRGDGRASRGRQPGGGGGPPVAGALLQPDRQPAVVDRCARGSGPLDREYRRLSRRLDRRHDRCHRGRPRPAAPAAAELARPGLRRGRGLSARCSSSPTASTSSRASGRHICGPPGRSASRRARAADGRPQLALHDPAGAVLAGASAWCSGRSRRMCSAPPGSSGGCTRSCASTLPSPARCLGSSRLAAVAGSTTLAAGSLAADDAAALRRHGAGRPRGGPLLRRLSRGRAEIAPARAVQGRAGRSVSTNCSANSSGLSRAAADSTRGGTSGSAPRVNCSRSTR